MPPGETIDDFIGRTAVEYLEAYKHQKPWLLFVGFGGPHEPWDPPSDWAAKYNWQQVDSPAPPCPPPSWLPADAAEHQRRLQHDSGLPVEIQKKIRALYYAKISHIDDWIGRIMDAVKRRGWDDRTAVIFWSDHGEMLGDKGRYHKTVFYEQSVRVPFILRLPDRRSAGQIRQQLVSLVDAFPTILELAEAPARQREFGRSLIPLVTNANVRHHEAVFSEIDKRTMIQDYRYKLVVDHTGALLKLYDLQEDPAEEINLVGKSGYGDISLRLLNILRQWYLATPTDQRHFRRGRLQ